MVVRELRSLYFTSVEVPAARTRAEENLHAKLCRTRILGSFDVVYVHITKVLEGFFEATKVYLASLPSTEPVRKGNVLFHQCALHHLFHLVELHLAAQNISILAETHLEQ